MQFRDLFLTRDISALLEETHSSGEELRRSIGAFGLTAYGVGAIIGTGIFVVIG
jgi:APA family basic amino acid/polyamine antiporter